MLDSEAEVFVKALAFFTFSICNMLHGAMHDTTRDKTTDDTD